MKILLVFKNKQRSIYAVEKNQLFIKKGRQLLDNLKINQAFAYELDEEYTKMGDAKVAKIKEGRVENFQIDKNSQIDFVFGTKKIFIIFSYNKDMQQRFSTIIFDIFEGK